MGSSHGRRLSYGINEKEKYLPAFLIGFLIMLTIFLPVVIANNGYFTYYGDFNSQQIPFYYHAHEMVRDGNFFWDWGTDLGADFIGSYSFYLLGSPFFWLTVIFPTKAVPYLMSFLLCIKYGVASLTAYAYIRRFVRNKNAALIGSLLYAFSGFQSYNIFFNHFHDVTAFFPLMLIAIEERVTNNRRGVFALSVAFMAILNYFFFTGQAVFCIIYFIARIGSKDFKVNFRKFASIAFEAIAGVMISAFFLLPSILAITGNYRVNERLYGMNLLAYSDKTIILRIVQSFFMIPDVPARPNLFSSDGAKWSSIGGFLPLFSMAGVIAFIQHKKKHWATKIFFVCMIAAFIPILNSGFYMFNSSYYARWYYMPILIMAMMTAYAFDNNEISFKFGVKVCLAALGVASAVFFLPVNDSDKVQWLSFAEYPIFFWITIGVTLANLLMLIFILKNRAKGIAVMKFSVIAVAAACLVCTSTVFYYGVSIGPYPKEYAEVGIEGGEKISLEDDKDFYRIDVSESYDNYPMFWGFSSMRTFHSIVPPSIMNFYSSVGIQRDVASRAPLTSYTLRGLFSVKYYFDKTENFDDKDKTIELPGFEYYDTQNGFDVYKNKYFIPMGFTYDYYVDKESMDLKAKSSVEKILIKALCLDDEQIEKYSDMMELIPTGEVYDLSEKSYYEECENRISSSCSNFEYSTNGFKAEISLDKSDLVFFSVPYTKGWTATVNGNPVEVENVSYGFMAVKADAGENVIEFKYVPDGFKEGIYISIAGLMLLIIYLIISRRIDKKRHNKHTHYYDYTNAYDIEEYNNYINEAIEYKDDKENNNRSDNNAS